MAWIVNEEQEEDSMEILTRYSESALRAFLFLFFTQLSDKIIFLSHGGDCNHLF